MHSCNYLSMRRLSFCRNVRLRNVENRPAKMCGEAIEVQLSLRITNIQYSMHETDTIRSRTHRAIRKYALHCFLCKSRNLRICAASADQILRTIIACINGCQRKPYRCALWTQHIFEPLMTAECGPECRMYQRLISSSQFWQYDPSKGHPMLSESYRIEDKLLLLSETFRIRVCFRATVNWEWSAKGEKQQFSPFLLRFAWFKNYKTKQNKMEKKIRFMDFIDVSSQIGIIFQSLWHLMMWFR